MNFYEWFFVQEGRTPEGYMSLEHILSVTITLIVFIAFAIILGIKIKNNSKAINIVLVVSAILMIGLYIGRFSDVLYRNFVYYKDTNSLATEEGVKLFFSNIVNNLPLFLCDMAIIAIPICAFTKGRVRTIFADFLGIWGIPMGFIGTYLAGNVYPSNCIISFGALTSLFIHVIPAFVSLFIFVVGLNTMERRNMYYVIGMFVGFMFFVLIYDYIFNPLFDANFMFFFRGDGTPFDLYLLLVGVKPGTEASLIQLMGYQTLIILTQTAYMVIFYLIYFPIRKTVIVKKDNFNHAF